MSGRRWQTEGIEVKLDGRVEASDSTFNSYPDYNECRPVHKPHPQHPPPLKCVWTIAKPMPRSPMRIIVCHFGFHQAQPKAHQSVHIVPSE